MATYKIMAFIFCHYSTSSSVLLVHYGPVFVAKFLLVSSLLLDFPGLVVGCWVPNYTSILKIFIKTFKGFRKVQKHKNKGWHLSTLANRISLRISIPKSLAEWS